jgi:hypothetical protein
MTNTQKSLNAIWPALPKRLQYQLVQLADFPSDLHRSYVLGYIMASYDNCVISEDTKVLLSNMLENGSESLTLYVKETDK